MYSWYFLKDSPSTGSGHRHDWEKVIIWFDKQGKPYRTYLSAHSSFSSKSWAKTLMDNTRPLVKYVAYWPLNHELAFTTTKGGSQPMVDWATMSSRVQRGLKNADFGEANVPFIPSNYEKSLADTFPF